MKVLSINPSAGSSPGGKHVEIVTVRTLREPVLLAKRPVRPRSFADCPELEGLERDESGDVQVPVDDEPEIIEQSGPLEPADVPVGRPLAWRVVNIDGSLLLDVGAVLPSAADRDFLFEKFEPQREVVGQGLAQTQEKHEDNATAQEITLSNMGLTIGSRLGVKSGIGSAMSPYASRVIGITPGELIFITVPMSSAGRLSLAPRDTVEVVAVSARAVYLFVCNVEAVCPSPTPYIILSKPRIIRRLRERRAERIKIRIPVIFSGAPRPGAPAAGGLGIANDLSDLGMALATPTPIAALGDTISVRFYLDMHASTICVEAGSTVRNVKPLLDDNEEQTGYEYGLEFAQLPIESKLALRNFALSRRSMG
ncbi:MAG: flagellar brake protein [Janthinobacterium lividum]